MAIVNNYIPYQYRQTQRVAPYNADKKDQSQKINDLVNQLGQKTQLPNPNKNYCEFNYPLVKELVKYREAAIPSITDKLSKTSDEKTIVEGIYVLDRMIDAGVKGVEKTYPTLSRFNNTTSPSVQAMLSGVYRKTQVPDAFGPLCKMLIRNSLLPTCPYFDPNEEIGGAILEYIRNKDAAAGYNNQKDNKKETSKTTPLKITA